MAWAGRSPAEADRQRSVIKIMAVAIRLIKTRDEPSGDRTKTDPRRRLGLTWWRAPRPAQQAGTGRDNRYGTTSLRDLSCAGNHRHRWLPCRVVSGHAAVRPAGYELAPPPMRPDVERPTLKDRGRDDGSVHHSQEIVTMAGLGHFRPIWQVLPGCIVAEKRRDHRKRQEQQA